MQPIERYALVTLLFLVALVMVVAFWDDDSPEPEKAKADVPIARVDERGPEPLAPRNAARPASRERPPIAGRDELAPTTRRVTTREPVAPRGPAASAGSLTAENTAAPPTPPKDLEDMLRPERGEKAMTAPIGPLQPLDRPLRKTERASNRRVVLSETSAPKSSSPKPVERPARSNTRVSEPKASEAPSRTYTIRSGDTLERIARNELGDARAVGAIATLNGLSDADTIIAGTTLKLPARSAVEAASRSGASAPETVAGGRSVYTVQRGDALSVVLEKRFGTYRRSIGIVKKLNPDLDPDRVVEGTRIVMPRNDEIPGGVTPPAPSTDVASASEAPRSRDRSSSSKKTEYVVR
ncbi:MAG: LysM peptidoglycan-binding domain-containing protein [Planctomycetota bacterium]